MAFNWDPQSLNRANAIASGMRPDRWLSLDGRSLLKIVDVLSAANPTASATYILRKIQDIGKAFNWDIPNMNTQAEESFLRWVITQRIAGAK
jgi:hypothetical protein